jgi:hypothetical protein
MTKTMTSVVCPECHHENEPERVYCHDCGARLDRSAVKVRKEDVADARKRVKKLFDPQRAKIRALFFKGSKVVLGACGVAALLQMFLPPDIPPPGQTAMLASQIRFDLERAVTRHQPPLLQYTDEQINGFLVYALKPKQKSLDEPLLDFKRAVVGFREGVLDVTMERSLFGFSVYTTWNFAPKLVGGKFTGTTKGASIGRLPIHPQVAQFMGVLFIDLRAALDSEMKLVSKFQALEFHDKNVVLTTP